MPAWAVDGEMLTFHGTDGDTRRVRAGRWRPDHGASPAESRSIRGRTRTFSVRTDDVTIFGPDGTSQRIDAEWQADARATYVLAFGGRPHLQCTIMGRPAIERDAGRFVTVRTRRPRSVTFTGWTEPRVLDRSLAIPPSVAGVRGLINEYAAAMAGVGPDRSMPYVRRSVPSVRLDDDAEPSRPADGPLAIAVPTAIEPLLVCAPLAYYLGIPIRSDEGDAVRLVRTDGSWTYPLGSMPTLPATVLRVLRRLLVLDAHVRVVGPHPAPADGRARLEQFGLDAEDLYRTSEPERLERYLSLDDPMLGMSTPDWPLTTYLPADVRAARALPYAVSRLSAVALPRAGELDDAARIKRALDGYWRGTRSRVPVLDADVTGSRYHAWVGEGVPIEVASLDVETAGTPGPVPNPKPRVAIVENDPEMTEETADRPEPGVELRRFRGLTRAELATVFAAGYDYVHYVGHCESAGLACVDGYWHVPDRLAEPPVSFCLNACQSYIQGRALVAAGSRAGAVTFASVVDGEAAKVGRTFIDLLLAGASVERALAVARREILMGQEYGIVGDPGHRLREATTDPPPIVRARRLEGELEIRVDTTGARSPGRVVPGTLSGAASLAETTVERRVPVETGWAWLREQPHPIVLDGSLHLPTELPQRPDASAVGDRA